MFNSPESPASHIELVLHSLENLIKTRNMEVESFQKQTSQAAKDSISEKWTIVWGSRRGFTRVGGETGIHTEDQILQS